MYSVTLDNKKVSTQDTPQNWFSDIIIPHQKNDKRTWYINDILRMFNNKGILFFERLDIWHIKELQDQFTKEQNRKPIPQKYPAWLVALNTIKNKIKYGFK